MINCGLATRKKANEQTFDMGKMKQIEIQIVNIQIFSNALDMKDAYRCLQNANIPIHTQTDRKKRVRERKNVLI